jgi:hypothetical protein
MSNCTEALARYIDQGYWRKLGILGVLGMSGILGMLDILGMLGILGILGILGMLRTSIKKLRQMRYGYVVPG